MKNKAEDLRNHLFATLEDLRDTEKPMEINRALAIAEVGKVIIDSVKAETAHLKALDDIGIQVTADSGFISHGGKAPLPPARSLTTQ